MSRSLSYVFRLHMFMVRVHGRVSCALPWDLIGSGLALFVFRAAFLDSLVVRVSACHVEGSDLILGREAIFLLVSFSDLVSLEIAVLSVLVLLEPLAGLPDLILRAPADLSHLV